MPLLRYFVFVGGALLTLLFAISAFAPPPAVEAAKPNVDLSIVRIHSAQKWPERIVFDTSRPTIPAPQNLVASTLPVVAPQVQPPQKSAAAALPLKKGVREAYAQVTSAPTQHHRADRRKSRNYANPTAIVVAQEPHFGLFGSIW